MTQMTTDRRPAICVLIEDFYPVMHGATTHFLLLSDRLMKAGVNVFILTRQIEPGHARREWVKKLEILRVKPAVGLNRSGKFLMLIPAFWTLIRERRRYDIILVCDLKVLGILGLLAARLLRKKCLLRVSTCGELDLAGWELKAGAPPGILSELVKRLARIRNRFLFRTDEFISISSAVTEEMLRVGVVDEKIVRIPNGIDTGRFSPVRPEDKTRLRSELGLPDGKLFIYTGRLARRKGLELLLEVWKDLIRDHPEDRLALVGSGQGYPEAIEIDLRAYVAKHGLTHSVIFTGIVGNVEAYLQASDFFVFPSESDNAPLSLIEAMACALPTVATAVGGIPDIMKHQENGILVPSGDKTRLHESMNEFLTDTAKARCLGQEARRTVLEKFDIDGSADKYLALFHELMNGSTPEPREKRPLPG